MLNLQTHFEDAVKGWKERLSCSAPGCRDPRKLWGRISNTSGSAQIHGQRYCLPLCFERELQRRLLELRVSGERRPRPPHRVPLGLLMLSRGELNHGQLRKALDAQKQNGSGRIGEWIQKLGYAQEEQVTAALGAQWSCPVLRNLPASAADCAIPFQLLRDFHMLPVHYSRITRVLHMAFAADIDYQALLAIEQMLECKAEPCVANETALQALLSDMDEQRRGNDHVFGDMRGPEEMTRIIASYAAEFASEDVHLVGCGEYIWVRIQGNKHSANLLFREANSNVLAWGRKLPGGRAGKRNST